MEERKFKLGDKVRFTEIVKGTNHFPCVEYDTKIRKIVEVNSICLFSPSYRLEGLLGNWFNAKELELIREVDLSDLQFADILTLRNGERYVVANGCMYEEDNDYFCNEDYLENNYNNDLTRETGVREYDIVKVERAGQVIYERKEEAKEMTVEEISEALGYEVKVVK